MKNRGTPQSSDYEKSTYPYYKKSTHPLKIILENLTRPLRKD